MKIKIAVAGIISALGLTLALASVPVLAQTPATTSTTKAPLTLEQQKAKITEQLQKKVDKMNQLLEDIKSGKLTTNLNDRIQKTTDFEKKIQSATTQDELKSILQDMRANMKAKMQKFIENHPNFNKHMKGKMGMHLGL